MSSSLSNFVNNLSKGIHKVKYKYGHSDNKCETCGLQYKDSNCFLEYRNFKTQTNVYVAMRIIQKSLLKT